MNQSNLGKGLLVLGIMMLVLAIPLSVVATVLVQGTIDSASVRTAENTWESESWLTSVDYRDYYAYNVTNVDEVNEFPSGWSVTPNFELKGPYTYKVTTERVFVSHNSSQGTYEYTESSSFESCFEVDCDGRDSGENPKELVSNLNVPYATLRVATLPKAFELIRDAMESTFAVKMLSEYDYDSEFQSWFSTEEDFDKFLNGGDGTRNPTGILAEGPTSEPIYFGVRNFVDSAISDKQKTMTDYGIINSSGMDTITDLTSNWLNDVSTKEINGTYLVDDFGDPYPEGVTENITASDYANFSFGGVDPIDGSLHLLGLNNGGFLDIDRTINLGNNLSGEVLDSMSTTTGSAGFVYMSLSGFTPPMTDVSGPTYGPGGLEIPKYTGFSAYVDDAWQGFALEHLTMNVIFNDLVPRYLEGIGSERWSTLSMNEWLFGWHDPATAFTLGGSSDNYSTGWFSLDANSSFYVNPELAELGVEGPENPVAWIVRDTGEYNLNKLDKLYTLNNLSELDWHSKEMYEGTYGIVEWEPNGLRYASGGWVDGTNIDCENNNVLKYNLAGFLVPEIPCVGYSDVKGIEALHYSIETNASERPIQAKLLNTKTLLDALPGSIPLYFDAKADIYAEPKSGYIIKGDVVSTFYLDVAALNNPSKENPTSNEELQPVFVIEVHPELNDEQADTIKSQIYTNQNIVTWWTNFDTPFDFILPILVLISSLSFFFGSKVLIETEKKEEE